MFAMNPLSYASHAAKMDRRRFLGAATASAMALPAARLWAQAAAGPGAIPDTLSAVSGSGKPVTLSAADLRDLRASLRGDLLLSQDAAYDGRAGSGTAPSIGIPH